jgi:hypothetical protein
MTQVLVPTPNVSVIVFAPAGVLGPKLAAFVEGSRNPLLAVQRCVSADVQAPSFQEEAETKIQALSATVVMVVAAVALGPPVLLLVASRGFV